MITIVWEYQVKADRVAEFEQSYAPDGRWAELFKRGKGFLGTWLIRSKVYPDLFLTMDQWESLKDYKTFLAIWKSEYETLDKQCEALTQRETCLGTFGVGVNDEGYSEDIS